MNDVYADFGSRTAHWSTTNLAEAMPAVQTPLSCSVWRPGHERVIRRCFADLGALERSRTGLPADEGEWITGWFSGRIAARVEFLGEMGDRLPGTSGAAIAEQFLGTLPEGFRSENTLSRLPAIGLRMPVVFARAPGRVRERHDELQRAWLAAVARPAPASLEQARRELKEALSLFQRAFVAHGHATLANVQPAYDGIMRLAASAGHPELAGRLFAGQGS